MSQEYTLEDVQAHTSKTSCWIILHNDVYDVTQWLQDHPGGNEILLEAAGQDCTLQFEENKHSDDARGFASKYKIGHLAGSPQIAMPRYAARFGDFGESENTYSVIYSVLDNTFCRNEPRRAREGRTTRRP